MQYREKLGYIALGGFLMLVGMLAAGLLSPIGAHIYDSPDAEFGKITCREIEVVDSEGYPLAIIGTESGFGGFGYISVMGYAANIQALNEGGFCEDGGRYRGIGGVQCAFLRWWWGVYGRRWIISRRWYCKCI